MLTKKEMFIYGYLHAMHLEQQRSGRQLIDVELNDIKPDRLYSMMREAHNCYLKFAVDDKMVLKQYARLQNSISS